MRRPLRAAALRAAAALALVAAAAAPAVPAPVAPSVTVVPLDGAPVKGALAGIGPSGVRVEGHEAPVPLDRVRQVTFDARAFPAEPASAGPRVRVALRGGEVLRGSFVDGSTDWLEMESADVPRVRVPFDAVLRIEAESARKGACDDPAQRYRAREGTDVAYARNGDAFGGTWVAATKEGVAIEASGSRTTVRWSDLVVLHVDETRLPPDRGLVAEVETILGSRLVTTDVASDGTTLRAKTRSGLEIAVPTSSLLAVRWTGGAFVYASDLDWTSTVSAWHKDGATEPGDFYDAWFAARADLTRHGCPLRVAGVTHRHGFAVHAKSHVEVPLGKAYARFECSFGVDDEALEGPEGARGDVTARVLVDGREAWSSQGSVKGGEPARAVGPVDVSGASTLVLEVDFGGGLDVMDRADWVDPILVRAGS